MKTPILRSALLGLLVCSYVSTGCASNAALRGAIADRDAEINQLRDERSRLKEQLQGIASQRDNLEVSLNDAALRLTEQPELMGQAFPELDQLGIDYGTRDGHVVISLPAKITFASGKAELSTSGRTALQAVAARLKSEFTGARFHIEGHTDSDPITRSSFSSNRELSLARAMAVLGYLVEGCEVDDDRFVVVGHGQYHPVSPNDSADGKARNRRVEIVVHQGAE